MKGTRQDEPTKKGEELDDDVQRKQLLDYHPLAHVTMYLPMRAVEAQ